MARGKSKHQRNTQGMLLSPRCGAKTRRGTPCRSPAVSEKKRCRMHGGAAGSGAPKGNKNALKTALHTAEHKKLKRQIREIREEHREMQKFSEQ
jgi:hypothetical protein